MSKNKNKLILFYSTSIIVLITLIISFTIYQKYKENLELEALYSMTLEERLEKQDTLIEKIKNQSENNDLDAEQLSEIGSITELKANNSHNEDYLYEAISYYEESISKESKNSLTLYRLGNVYVKLGDLETALKYREILVELDDSYDSSKHVSYISLAQLIFLKDIDKALEIANKALSYAGDNQSSIDFIKGNIEGFQQIKENKYNWEGYDTFFDKYYTDLDLILVYINQLLEENDKISPELEKELTELKKFYINYVSLPDNYQ